MLFEKSPFSGSVINYRTPCRSSEGRLCDVFADLTLWNEFFWQVGLELREFSPGQLCLAEMCDGEMFPDRLEKEEAATLLCHLLSHHRCIVSVHLNYHVYSGHHQLICDSLRKSQSLRKLKFCQQNMILKCSQSFAAVLPHLNQLQELELSHVYLDCTSLEALSEFLATTRSLTTLTMTDHSNVGREAVVILRGLRQNVTISTLSFHTDLLRATSYRLCETFADF
ncbi:hypothetical protein HPB52_006712 [Rhipicephalus sanguineus]|uniref:Uncharacterized protein n=1 Tax=Rhipicephalus sanguineus TaxID=34632 RepID=A0A9D4PIA9_RHISA|nr:hypothetical protein HPB52_006712 [Rhipicephalus sanguineus]